MRLPIMLTYSSKFCLKPRLHMPDTYYILCFKNHEFVVNSLMLQDDSSRDLVRLTNWYAWYKQLSHPKLYVPLFGVELHGLSCRIVQGHGLHESSFICTPFSELPNLVEWLDGLGEKVDYVSVHISNSKLKRRIEQLRSYWPHVMLIEGLCTKQFMYIPDNPLTLLHPFSFHFSNEASVTVVTNKEVHLIPNVWFGNNVFVIETDTMRNLLRYWLTIDVDLLETALQKFDPYVSYSFDEFWEVYQNVHKKYRLK